MWKRYPAFYVSILILIGVASAFFLPCLVVTLLFKKRLFWILPVLTLVYVKCLCPYLPKEDVGKGHIHIEEVKRHVSSFHTSLVYIGKVVFFDGKKRRYRGLPVRIYLPLKHKKFPANQDYLIEGSLRRVCFGGYILKPTKHVAWLPIPHTHSLAQWRYDMKDTVKKWVFRRFQDKKVALLMSVFATGNVESLMLAHGFNIVGLQHLLAISGFHFALLSFWLAWVLKRVLGEKGVAIALLVFMSLYFFYMGGAPSIQRAWIAVGIHFLGLFFDWRPSPLNSLGVALLTALILDPLALFHIGFQLSFGATAGILLFYRWFERHLEGLFPRRPFEKLLKMSRPDQCGVLVCAYLRSALALQAATLPFSLPLVLFHFKVFPLISIFYNLFFPFLFSILFVLFLFHLDFLASPFASFLLMLIEYSPKRLLVPLTPLQTIGGVSLFACVILIQKKDFLMSRVFILLEKWKRWMTCFRIKKRPRRDSNTRPVA